MQLKYRKSKRSLPAGPLYWGQSFLIWAWDPHRKQPRFSSCLLQRSPLCAICSLAPSRDSPLSRMFSALFSWSRLCLDLGPMFAQENVNAQHDMCHKTSNICHFSLCVTTGGLLCLIIISVTDPWAQSELSSLLVRERQLSNKLAMVCSNFKRQPRQSWSTLISYNVQVLLLSAN